MLSRGLIGGRKQKATINRILYSVLMGRPIYIEHGRLGKHELEDPQGYWLHWPAEAPYFGKFNIKLCDNQTHKHLGFILSIGAQAQ